jgi:hypothetical protein
MLDWRQQQLSWFEDHAVIKQDHDLLEKIKQVNPRSILLKGDSEHFQSLIDPNNTLHDFCIYIVNHSFNFNTLVNDINAIIDSALQNNSTLYLSINKYLAQADTYDINLPSDYDLAIKQFVISNVQAELQDYYSGAGDDGKQFNWVHPLTRFYFKITK